MPLNHAAATNVGNVRDNNEDCYLSNSEMGLWIIADGMGGHDAGEVASSLARDFIEQAVKQGKALTDAIKESHFAVIDASLQNIGSPNMGTTIVALRSHGAQYEIAWVGDSRAYLWDGEKVQQISKDHSLVQLLIEAGDITPEEAENHPQKHVITQSIGVSALSNVDVSRITGLWEKDHRVILCSDGLSDLVSQDEIQAILACGGSEQMAVDRLIDKALSKGGHDNVTVSVISAPEDITLSEKLQRFALKSPLLSPMVNNAKDKIRLLTLIFIALLCGLAALLFNSSQLFS